jgi:hypothetical protein
MSMRVLVVLAVLCLTLSASPALARGYGDGFGLGGVLLPDGDPAILGTTRLGDSIGLEFAFGLDVVSDNGDADTDFVVGAAMRKYWSVDDQFQPFFGGRASLLYVDHAGHEETLIGLSALVGGEYFVTRRVSLRGDVELGFYFGSVEIRTGTTLAAFMYL